MANESNLQLTQILMNFREVGGGGGGGGGMGMGGVYSLEKT